MKNPLFHTRVCSLLGIRYPIIEGGMAWISDAALAAAVSNAGGLGQIAAGSLSDEGALRREIEKARELTDKPIGINIPLISPGAEWMIEVVIDEGVSIITTSAGSPSRFTRKIKEHGLRVIHVVPSARLAKKAEDAGVDAVVAEGIEAGGHDSADEITTMVLIPQVVDRVKIPVIAAGGVADARGFVAARALGAEGIQMGTRFVVTRECRAHDKFKRAIIDAEENSTVLTARTIGHPVRALRNPFADKVIEMERRGIDAAEIFEFIGPGRTRSASIDGDIIEGSVMAGQVAGMINEEKSVEMVIRDIIEGSQEIVKKLSDAN